MTETVYGVKVWREQGEPPRVLFDTAIGTICVVMLVIGKGVYADTIAAGRLAPFFNMQTGRNLLYRIWQICDKDATGMSDVNKGSCEQFSEWVALNIYVAGKQSEDARNKQLL